MKKLYAYLTLCSMFFCTTGYATIHEVTNYESSGTATLLKKIEEATNGDTITFVLDQPTRSIAFSNSVTIDKDIVILGPGTKRLSINCADQSVFVVSSGHLTLDKITLSGPNAIVLKANTELTSNYVLLTNSFGGSSGGAINANDAIVNLTYCSFDNNGTNLNGGAIALTGTSTLNANHCTFYQNQAGSASGLGGALYIEENSTANLDYCSISQNSAFDGDEVYTKGAFNIYMTLISDKIIDEEGDITGEVNSLGYNLISETEGLTGNFPTATDIDEEEGFIDDYGNYGGHVPTLRISSSSPAIDKGDPSITTDVIATDARWAPRVLDGKESGTGRIDIGAFEFSPFTIQSSEDYNPVIALINASEADSPLYIDFDIVENDIIEIFSPESIQNEVIIDGFSQEGAMLAGGGMPNVPGIEFGSEPEDNSTPIEFLSGSEGSMIRGMSLSGFTSPEGERITINIKTSNIDLYGNFIGTRKDGTTLSSNYIGINLDGASNIQIGGTEDWQRNVIINSEEAEIRITNNSSSVTIVNTLIGIDASGFSGTSNSVPGIQVTSGNDIFIGGLEDGERNFFAHNIPGIELSGTEVFNIEVKGNYFGLGTDGVTELFIDESIVISSGAHDNTVGGLNVFAYTDAGIILDGTNTNNNLIIGNSFGILPSGDGKAPINGNGIEIQSEANFNTIQNNYFAAISNAAILLYNAEFNTIKGNKIGLLPNSDDVAGISTAGIVFDDASHNTIGGLEEGDENLIAGTPVGIYLLAFSDSNYVLGNYIGLKKDLTTPAPNSSEGIKLEGEVKYNVIGGWEDSSNTIAYTSAGPAIAYYSDPDFNYPISNQHNINSIYGNSFGISNNYIQPLISSLSSDSTVSGLATSSSTIYLYADSSNQGQYFIDSIHVNSEGVWTKKIDFSTIPEGLDYLTAIEYASTGSSIFSERFLICFNPFVITEELVSSNSCGSFQYAINIAQQNNETKDIITFDLPNDTLFFDTEIYLEFNIEQEIIIDAPFVGIINDTLIFDGETQNVVWNVHDSYNAEGEDLIQIYRDNVTFNNLTINGSFPSFPSKSVDYGIYAEEANNIIITDVDFKNLSKGAVQLINSGGSIDNATFMNTEEGVITSSFSVSDADTIKIKNSTFGQDENTTLTYGIRHEGQNVAVIEGNRLNASIAIKVQGSVEIYNNVIGLLDDNVTPSASTDIGIEVTGGSKVLIGNGNLSNANTIAGCSEHAIYLNGTYDADINLNYIGTNSTGENIGNDSAGIYLSDLSMNDTIINNYIAFNHNGILIDGGQTEGNYIYNNKIYSNSLLGIDLINGAHYGLAAPTIDSLTADSTLYGTGESEALIHVYADNENEGIKLLAETSVGPNQSMWSVKLTTGDFINITASNLDSLTAIQSTTSGSSRFSSAKAPCFLIELNTQEDLVQENLAIVLTNLNTALENIPNKSSLDVITSPTKGEFIDNGNFNYSYQSEEGIYNDNDSIQLTVTNDCGNTKTSWFYITIENSAPNLINSVQERLSPGGKKTIDLTEYISDLNSNLDSNTLAIIDTSIGNDNGKVSLDAEEFGIVSIDFTENPEYENAVLTSRFTICDDLGLCDTAVINIKVSVEPDSAVVYNVITPNDDNINDFLKIDKLDQEEFSDHILYIYDKWGALVFKTKQYHLVENRWYGKHQNGENLPQGMYMYVLDLNYKSDKFKPIQKGFIELQY